MCRAPWTGSIWNAELVRGDDLGKLVQQLKREPGKGLLVGGAKLPLALAEPGLIDEYEFVVRATDRRCSRGYRSEEGSHRAFQPN